MEKEKDYFVLYTPDVLEKTYELLQKDFSRSDILTAIKSDDDTVKQVALFKLETIENPFEAESLVSVLTGQSGPVREVCSFRINEFLSNENSRVFFDSETITEQLLNALNDIIPSVARNIINVIHFIPNKNNFLDKLMKRIIDIDLTQENSATLSNHEISKNTFKLYWYMEALSELLKDKTLEYDENSMNEILKKSYKFEDYTIREKAAKLISEISDFDEYRDSLRNDTNPYVYHYLK